MNEVGLAGTVRQRRRTISRKEVADPGVRGKPKCPYCRKPLTFVCNDVKGGHLNQKCGKCGKGSIVDMGTMEAIAIDDLAS